MKRHPSLFEFRVCFLLKRGGWGLASPTPPGSSPSREPYSPQQHHVLSFKSEGVQKRPLLGVTQSAGVTMSDQVESLSITFHCFSTVNLPLSTVEIRVFFCSKGRFPGPQPPRKGPSTSTRRDEWWLRPRPVVLLRAFYSFQLPVCALQHGQAPAACHRKHRSCAPTLAVVWRELGRGHGQ